LRGIRGCDGVCPLAADRWVGVHWPEAYGGRDASIWEWLIFEEEYYRAGAPMRVTQNGIFLLAPTLFEFGTPEQQDRVLPRMAAAEDLWCQGWSEPGAGSDLAATKSRAVRDEAAAIHLPGEHWVATWAASPQAPIPGNLSQRGFAGQTVREIVDAGAGGAMVRVRLSNAFGAGSLRIAGIPSARVMPSA